MNPSVPQKPPLLNSLKSRARKLRREMTVPEKLIWSLVRNRRLDGLKFVRQCVIGPFIVDFCCFEARLVVELDGMSHVGAGVKDDKRTKKLEELGFRVVRFMNDDVIQHLDVVATAIAREAGLNW